jgi:cell division protein FtsB
MSERVIILTAIALPILFTAGAVGREIARGDATVESIETLQRQLNRLERDFGALEERVRVQDQEIDLLESTIDELLVEESR